MKFKFNKVNFCEVFKKFVVIPFKKVLKLKNRITNTLGFFPLVEIYFLTYIVLNNNLYLEIIIIINKIYLLIKFYFSYLYGKWNNLSKENKELILKFFYSLLILIFSHLMLKYSFHFFLFDFLLTLAKAKKKLSKEEEELEQNIAFFTVLSRIFFSPFYLLYNVLSKTLIGFHKIFFWRYHRDVRREREWKEEVRHAREAEEQFYQNLDLMGEFVQLDPNDPFYVPNVNGTEEILNDIIMGWLLDDITPGSNRKKGKIYFSILKQRYQYMCKYSKVLGGEKKVLEYILKYHGLFHYFNLRNIKMRDDNDYDKFMLDILYDLFNDNDLEQANKNSRKKFYEEQKKEEPFH